VAGSAPDLVWTFFGGKEKTVVPAGIPEIPAYSKVLLPTTYTLNLS